MPMPPYRIALDASCWFKIYTFFSHARASSYFFTLFRSLNPSLYLFCWHFFCPHPHKLYTHTLILWRTTTEKKNSTREIHSAHTERTQHENYYGKINRFLIREKYNFNGKKSGCECQHTIARKYCMSSYEIWFARNKNESRKNDTTSIFVCKYSYSISNAQRI